MAYQKQTWAAGDTIGDAALNHIEDGIFAADTAASAAQDTADNAVTDITLGDSTTPLAKTNGAVTIPAATSKTDGFMTSEQAAKLADAVTDITLGSSATPLTKTNGAVNIPDKIKTATLTGTLESLSAGKYLSITIPHTVPAGYSFAGAILIGNGWTNGMISYVVYSNNSQIVVGNYAISGDQANKTITLTAIYIKV